MDIVGSQSKKGVNNLFLFLRIRLLQKDKNNWGFLNPSLCSVFVDRQLTLSKAGKIIHLRKNNALYIGIDRHCTCNTLALRDGCTLLVLYGCTLLLVDRPALLLVVHLALLPDRCLAPLDKVCLQSCDVISTNVCSAWNVKA